MAFVAVAAAIVGFAGIEGPVGGELDSVAVGFFAGGQVLNVGGGQGTVEDADVVDDAVQCVRRF